MNSQNIMEDNMCCVDLFRYSIIYCRTSIFMLIYWQRDEFTITTVNTRAAQSTHMCCWLLARTITGYFMHQLRVWSCRDSRSSAATCNMCHHWLPASPMRISLLTVTSSSSQTDVQFLTFSTYQKM